LCQDAFDQNLIKVSCPALSAEDTESFLTLHRLKQLGNVRFIGELYKQGLINISTLLNISRQLIDSRLPYEFVEIQALVLDEDRLESVNTLLETVEGKFKQCSKVKAVVGLIFEILGRIVRERGDVSMKVKFRLMVRCM
jgi:hypothetical protein